MAAAPVVQFEQFADKLYAKAYKAKGKASMKLPAGLEEFYSAGARSTNKATQQIETIFKNNVRVTSKLHNGVFGRSHEYSMEIIASAPLHYYLQNR